MGRTLSDLQRDAETGRKQEKEKETRTERDKERQRHKDTERKRVCFCSGEGGTLRNASVRVLVGCRVVWAYLPFVKRVFFVSTDLYDINGADKQWRQS